MSFVPMSIKFLLPIRDFNYSSLPFNIPFTSLAFTFYFLSPSLPPKCKTVGEVKAIKVKSEGKGSEGM